MQHSDAGLVEQAAPSALMGQLELRSLSDDGVGDME